MGGFNANTFLLHYPFLSFIFSTKIKTFSIHIQTFKVDFESFHKLLFSHKKCYNNSNCRYLRLFILFSCYFLRGLNDDDATREEINFFIYFCIFPFHIILFSSNVFLLKKKFMIHKKCKRIVK